MCCKETFIFIVSSCGIKTFKAKELNRKMIHFGKAY